MQGQLTDVRSDEIESMDDEIDSALAALSQRQRTFVLEYSVDGNGGRAARTAGYTTHASYEAACEVLRNPKIKHALRLLCLRHQLKVGINAKWKRMQLVKIIERSMQATPMTDADGKPVGVFEYDPVVALKAIDQLCRLDGDYLNRVEIGSSLPEEITAARERAGLR